LIGLIALALTGCANSGPSDAAQQQLVKDWDPEKVAQEYEKAGKQKEADEIRRGMNKPQGE
jgi:hypothetical protein